MIGIDEVIRSKRHSIAITISPEGRVVVRAPQKSNLTLIQKLVDSKASWILAQKSKIEQNYLLNKNIFDYRQILFLGNLYFITFDENIKKINLVANTLLVPYSFNNNLPMQLAKWYKKQALKICQGRVDYFSKLMNILPLKIRINNAKKNWGSCNSKKVIAFNLRLLMLPHDLIDYVIVHELAHLIELNHSARFWRIVNSILPDMKKRISQLHKGDYLLKLYR